MFNSVAYLESATSMRGALVLEVEQADKAISKATGTIKAFEFFMCIPILHFSH